jgi:CubicO group peptidase (beta-lactamase class C family)
MEPTSTLTADLQTRFTLAREAGILPNIHAVIAAHAGRTIFETYFPGTDSAGPRPLGIVRFGPETLHDLRSVTKSIVGLLYGIALSTGHVPPPESPLLDHFPEYPDLAADPARRALTIAHVLSMTLGTEWDESTLPYSDPRNSEIAMDRAADRCRYVLERPIIEPPGQRWIYNGGATAVLARLIAKGTGRPLHDYARDVLFNPLGLGPTEWRQGPHTEVSAASGLRMTPRDLLRIGLAMLANGQANGRQIIPQSWLEACRTPAVQMPDGRSYGYHWYLGAVPTDNGAGGVLWEPTISAMGNGGQRLFLLPRLDIAVVVTAGSYNNFDSWRPPMALLRDVLLPAILHP